MGFSVSGSAALVFVGLFLAFGMYHSATANSFERVSDAERDRSDALLDARNTALTISNASYDSSANELTVEVNNTGSTQLRVSETDLLVDGAYRTGWASAATVAGDADTDLWLTAEQLSVTLTGISSQPDRVKVVTGSAVSATAEVTAP
ncbi:flagellin [Halobacteriales archaeon Cl-PHB]